MGHPTYSTCQKLKYLCSSSCLTSFSNDEPIIPVHVRWCYILSSAWRWSSSQIWVVHPICSRHSCFLLAPKRKIEKTVSSCSYCTSSKHRLVCLASCDKSTKWILSDSVPSRNSYGLVRHNKKLVKVTLL